MGKLRFQIIINLAKIFSAVVVLIIRYSFRSKCEDVNCCFGCLKFHRDIRSEKEITKQAKLYEKLLGGEEARTQAGYDALLAAAPAFFKGKNLREAAPQVLESINKSGAFDKPRDIKQAAAQLAIQRRLLMDKAGAEEKQRLAILSMKNQKDVFDVLKDQQIPIGSYLGSYETANREGGPGVLPNKYYLTNNNVLVRIDKGKDGQLIPTALGKI